MFRSSDTLKAYALYIADGYLHGITLDCAGGDPTRAGYYGDTVYENQETAVVDIVELPAWVAYVLSDCGYGFAFYVLGLLEPDDIPHNGIVSDGYDAANLIARFGRTVQRNVHLWDNETE